MIGIGWLEPAILALLGLAILLVVAVLVAVAVILLRVLGKGPPREE